MPTNNNTLGITVTSTVSGALPGINNTTNALNGLSGAATGASTAVSRLAPAFQQNRGMLQTFIGQARAGQLAYQGLSGAAVNAGQAIQSTVRPAANGAATLSNLGRVASDLPFGFIAIQNNLDPLIGGFGALISSTGSISGAFGALRSALIGPAGLALGFSVVSAGVTKLIQEYGSLGNAFNALNPLTDKASRLQAELAAQTLKTGAEALKESSHLDLLYRATQDLNVPMDERRKIADSLIKQYPQTFKGLSQEAFLAGEAASAYEKLKDSILATAIVKAGDKVIEKRAASLFSLRQEIAELEKTQQKAVSVGPTTLFGQDTGGQAKLLQTLSAGINEKRKEAASIEADIKVIQDEQLKIIEEYGAVAAGINETEGKKAKKVKDVKTDLEKQAEVIKTLREKVVQLDAAFLAEGGTIKDLTDNKLKAFGKALGDLAIVGAGPGTELFESIRRELTSLQNVAQKTPVKIKIPIVIEPLPAQTNRAAIEGIAKGVSDDFSRAFASANDKAIAGILEKGAEDGIAAIAQGIGKAISGGGFAAVFDGFINAVANFGESLGKQLIAQGISLEAFKSSLSTFSGVQAVAAGAALIAASAAFRSLAKGGVPSFATGGGIVGGPQLAMIGDNPGREEYVIPSEVLNTLGGGSGYIAETRLSINELLIALKRAERNG